VWPRAIRCLNSYLLMAASIASYEVSPVVFKSRPSTSGQFCRGLPSLCRVCYAFYCIACSTVARACFMPEPSPRSFSSHSSGFQDERMQKKSTVRVNHISQINGNRSSAVAEMGDRLATIDMGRKVRVLLCPFSGGSGYLTQCRLGRDLPPYQLPSEILIHPVVWLYNRHGPKIGGCAPFGGELDPHLTQCGLAEAYLHTKWHLDPATRLATMHQHHRQDRIDNGPIA